jgi:hypothetical protein
VETLFGTDAAEAKGGSITCALPNPPAGPEDVPAAHLYRFTLEGNPHKFYLKLRYAPSTLEHNPALLPFVSLPSSAPSFFFRSSFVLRSSFAYPSSSPCHWL